MSNRCERCGVYVGDDFLTNFNSMLLCDDCLQEELDQEDIYDLFDYGFDDGA